MDQQAQVLVTGGSGFIASHCIIQLLQKGYHVKATVRQLKRSADVKAMLAVGGVIDLSRLSFVEADLSDAKSWTAAAQGCTYIIHLASPTPQPGAKTEVDFVIPAVNGVLSVLRAAKEAGIKRVVLTSAFGAVGYGTHKKTAYTEDDWSELGADVPFYQKSKTLSEKAAWEYVASDGKGLELSVVNPVAVSGPVLSGDYSHSIRAIHYMLNGQMKGLPKIRSGHVDVRDVADLHLRAMIDPAANGQRFLAAAGPAVSMLDIAQVLRQQLGDKASRVPTREMPSWLIRLIAVFNPTVRMVVPYLGLVKEASHEKATRLLGWQPRSTRESVVATAESLFKLGLVK